MVSLFASSIRECVRIVTLVVFNGSFIHSLIVICQFQSSSKKTGPISSACDEPETGVCRLSRNIACTRSLAHTNNSNCSPLRRAGKLACQPGQLSIRRRLSVSRSVSIETASSPLSLPFRNQSTVAERAQWTILATSNGCHLCSRSIARPTADQSAKQPTDRPTDQRPDPSTNSRALNNRNPIDCSERERERGLSVSQWLHWPL